MEIVINIDCEKIEKALNAICLITEKSPSVTIKELLQLNEMLMEIAFEIAKDKEAKSRIVKKYGQEILNDLLQILS